MHTVSAGSGRGRGAQQDARGYRVKGRVMQESRGGCQSVLAWGSMVGLHGPAPSLPNLRDQSRL